MCSVVVDPKRSVVPMDVKFDAWEVRSRLDTPAEIVVPPLIRVASVGPVHPVVRRAGLGRTEARKQCDARDPTKDAGGGD